MAARASVGHRCAAFGMSKIEPIAGSPSEWRLAGALLFSRMDGMVRVAGCHPGGHGRQAQADRPHWAFVATIVHSFTLFVKGKAGQGEKVVSGGTKAGSYCQ